MFRRTAFLMLALASLQGPFALGHAARAGDGKHAAMVIDGNTGAVLHSDDADELRHPASLTKMMTLYLAFELLEQGRMSMTDRVPVSQEAASQAPSNLDLEPGESISVSEAIRALVTKSANDVAVALAEKIGGSERNFVRLMNARARDLGMTKTNFENPSGLPDKNQVTTARDMITLGLRLQDHFPNYYPLFATRSFAFNRATYRNHNTLLNTFQGIDGIKTGYTRMSGFNLVSSVRRGGRHVVGAVFGGSSAASRNAEMRNLLTRALARASTTKTRKPQPMLITKLKSAPKIAERPRAKEQPIAQPPMLQPPVQMAEAPKAFAKPVTQPAPKVAAQPTGRRVAEPAPALQQPSLQAAEQTADAPQDAAAPIDVFKVKRVMVAPRQGPERRAPSADETTDMSATDTPSNAAPFVAASGAARPPADAIAALFAKEAAATETVIPKTTVYADAQPAAPQAPLGNTMAMLGASDVMPNAMDDAPEPTLVAPPVKAQRPSAQAPRAPVPRLTLASNTAPIERGRQPSSLQAQAARLPDNAPQRFAALEPDAYQPRTAEPTGRYEVQIGAYSSIVEAQRALTSAQSRAGKLLSGYGSVTHPVQKVGRTVYRARFSGFDANRATSTCNELRRQAIDCFVMTAE